MLEEKPTHDLNYLLWIVKIFHSFKLKRSYVTKFALSEKQAICYTHFALPTVFLWSLTVEDLPRTVDIRPNMRNDTRNFDSILVRKLTHCTGKHKWNFMQSRLIKYSIASFFDSCRGNRGKITEFNNWGYKIAKQTVIHVSKLWELRKGTKIIQVQSELETDSILPSHWLFSHARLD